MADNNTLTVRLNQLTANGLNDPAYQGEGKELGLGEIVWVQENGKYYPVVGTGDKTLSAFINNKNVIDNDTTYTFATGDTQGTFKVTSSTGESENITIKGLDSDSAAYKKESYFATSESVSQLKGTPDDDAMTAITVYGARNYAKKLVDDAATTVQYRWKKLKIVPALGEEVSQANAPTLYASLRYEEGDYINCALTDSHANLNDPVYVNAEIWLYDEYDDETPVKQGNVSDFYKIQEIVDCEENCQTYQDPLYEAVWSINLSDYKKIDIDGTTYYLNSNSQFKYLSAQYDESYHYYKSIISPLYYPSTAAVFDSYEITGTYEKPVEEGYEFEYAGVVGMTSDQGTYVGDGTTTITLSYPAKPNLVVLNSSSYIALFAKDMTSAYCPIGSGTNMQINNIQWADDSLTITFNEKETNQFNTKNHTHTYTYIY